MWSETGYIGLLVCSFYPSKQEGFGLAEVEAASFGLPVLGLAGTVTEELFPCGTGAMDDQRFVKRKHCGGRGSSLEDGSAGGKIRTCVIARVNAVFLEEHFIDRFRLALAPLLLSHPTLVTNIEVGGKKAPSTAQVASSSAESLGQDDIFGLRWARTCDPKG